MTLIGTNSTEFMRLPAWLFSAALIMQTLYPDAPVDGVPLRVTWHQPCVRGPPPLSEAPSYVEANGYSSHDFPVGRGSDAGQAVFLLAAWVVASTSR